MTKLRKPTTVGEMLQKEFLEPLGFTQRKFADHIGVEVKTINRLVNNKTSLTPVMALKLAASFGTTAEFWLNLQNANDLWELENSKIKLPSAVVS